MVVAVMNERRPLLPAALALGAGAAWLVAAASPAAQTSSFVDTLLERERFSTAERRAIGEGKAVVKVLDTPVRRELAHFGGVYIDAPADRFIERFDDIERFERGPGMPQIGRFGATPRLEDLASLTLPAKDVADLRACRPGACDVQLSSAAMARFHNEVDWKSPRAARQANAVVRQVLLELVLAYQSNGNAALGHYDDSGEPLAVADEFRHLLEGAGRLPVPVPGLLAYLETYPRGRPAGARDFIYWSVANFGLKPTIRVSHVVVYPLAARPSGVSHVIAIKQLYASHYFHTTLELRFIVEDERRAGQDGFHLFSITRSRNDGTTGLLGTFLRPVISRRSRSAVRGYLEHLKQQVERVEPAPF
jgi:hypothetical protein